MNVKNTPIKSAFLLIGSPRGQISASNYLGNYLLKQLENLDIQVSNEMILKAKEDKERVLQTILQNDLFILSSPLYVDTLPAPVIEFLTFITEKTDEFKSHKPKMLFLTNCGFPEALHCENIIDQVQFFSETVGFEWLGGLALGGGDPLKNKTPDDNSGMTRNVRKVLNIVADAMHEGLDIPKETKKLMAKSIIPIPIFTDKIYTIAGNRGWNNQAKKYGTSGKLYDKPYEIKE